MALNLLNVGQGSVNAVATLNVGNSQPRPRSEDGAAVEAMVARKRASGPLLSMKIKEGKAAATLRQIDEAYKPAQDRSQRVCRIAFGSWARAGNQSNGNV